MYCRDCFSAVIELENNRLSDIFASKEPDRFANFSNFIEIGSFKIFRSENIDLIRRLFRESKLNKNGEIRNISYSDSKYKRLAAK